MSETQVPRAATPTPESRPTATDTAASPTRTEPPQAAPTSTTVLKTPTALATPTQERPSSCPGAPPQRVQVNERAWVCTASDKLIVRLGPGLRSREVSRLEPGTDLTVIGGPECADSWSWWRVRADDGVMGWVAEGGDEVDPYFICPLE